MLRKQKGLIRSVFALALIPLAGIFLLVHPAVAAVARVEVLQSQEGYAAPGQYPIGFSIHIDKSWYIHGTHAGQSGLFPTSLKIDSSPHIEIREIVFPPAQKKTFSYADEPVAVYSGHFIVRATLAIRPNAAAGTHDVKGSFASQACSETSCLPPETVPIHFKIPVVPSDKPVTYLNRAVFEMPHQPPAPEGQLPLTEGRMLTRKFNAGLWLVLLGVFLGGLALNLTPCIYPLIPITVSYFGGSASRMGGSTVVHGIFYILGLAVTNSILGLAASLSGTLLGSILQNPFVLMGVAAILVILALSFFGLWELKIPAGLTGLAAKQFGGYFGTFFMGLTLGIVAAPCLGPFILGLLTYVGQKGDPFLGFLYFFVLSIGMGLPLAVLAVFSGAMNRLPMSGIWMVWIRKALGWVLIGMAVYLLQPLMTNPFMKQGLFGAILLAAGLHLGWLDKSQTASPVFARIKKVAGGLLILGAFATPLFIFLHFDGGIEWIPYDRTRLNSAAEAEKPVLLDFYAEWCGPCKALDREVFTNPEVVRLSQQFVNLRVDLTTEHPEQKVLQTRYHIRGVPTILLFDRNGKEVKPLRIESYVSAKDMAERMERLLAWE